MTVILNQPSDRETCISKEHTASSFDLHLHPSPNNYVEQSSTVPPPPNYTHFQQCVKLPVFSMSPGVPLSPCSVTCQYGKYKNISPPFTWGLQRQQHAAHGPGLLEGVRPTMIKAGWISPGSAPTPRYCVALKGTLVLGCIT